MKCPECSAEVEFIAGESEFCMQCGAELSAEESASAVAANALDSSGMKAVAEQQKQFSEMLKNVFAANSSVEVKPQPVIVVQKAAEVDNAGQAVIIQHQSAVPAMEFSRTASPDNNKLQSSAGTDDEKWINVEYNEQIFFISGSATVIKLRLTPLVSGLKRISIYMEVRVNGEVEKRQQIPVTVSDLNSQFKVQTSFDPGNISGSISLDFYIGCHNGIELNYYEFHADHPVYSANASSKQIINRFNMEINAAGASDVNVRDALSNIGKTDPTPYELISQLNELTPNFVRKTLSASMWRPNNGYMSDDPLLLRWNDFKILLFNKQKVVFGRDPGKSDIVVRGAEAEKNRTVSRVHGEISYTGDAVMYKNLSGNGSWINDREVPQNGVPLPDKARVEFGDINWNFVTQRCQRPNMGDVCCQSCCANKIKSVIVDRNDKSKEYYLLVWQCCELGRFFPELAGWDIFVRDDAFCIRTPDGDLTDLRPGAKIKNMEVGYFHAWK